MNAEDVVRKVRALQTKTVANGATEAEASEARAAATRLEARLGFEVAPLTPAAPRLGLRGRIYRFQASVTAREKESRKAKAMSHIIGLRR
jgi:hypothetical protein